MDNWQTLAVRESAVILHLMPFGSFYRLVRRLVGFRQPVHLAEHLTPVLEIFLHRHAFPITVAVIGHAHSFPFEKRNGDEVHPGGRDHLEQVPVDGRYRLRDVHPACCQIFDEVQLCLDQFHWTVGAVGQAQDARLPLVFVVIDQVGAAFVIVEFPQCLFGCAKQSGGSAEDLAFTKLGDFCSFHGVFPN